MEERIRELEIQIAELKKDAHWSRVLGGTVGLLLFAFLGYTSFFAIPREVKATTPGKAAEEVKQMRTSAQVALQEIERIEVSLKTNNFAQAVTDLERSAVRRGQTISLEGAASEGRFLRQSGYKCFVDGPGKDDGRGFDHTAAHFIVRDAVP